ncbi:leucyl aminopeptidase [Candidatus Profftia sp. (ex Adelges kitamiensis)]|uniref:leucyl aminopeptidase n=1 Tax=Candidatus Profftia sp. (ex Adelges kitamiensis) TaxID=2864218 RepID=UPI001CE2E5C1|nr:leucyl aminopeptidase [Candidatus Profftia sp. (ex Adelges kitamiensis)]
MKFSAEINSLEYQSRDCMIIGIFASRKLSPIAKKLDKISNGYISSILLRGALEGNVGQTLLLYKIPNVIPEQVLLIGCGKEAELDERLYKQIIKKTINTLKYIGSTKTFYFLTELHLKKRNTYWKVRIAVETIKETLYAFEQLKSKKSKLICVLHEIVFNVLTNHELNDAALAIKHGLAISSGITATKDLSNMPPNICNAKYLSLHAKQLADSFKPKISTFLIGEKEMKELGMSAYLAVGNGSQNESLMSVIHYKGEGGTAKPIVLIGKGLTFDSGGISIKTPENMDEMKYDMCGAASVYGVMLIAAKLKLPLNIIGILAGCENMINENSYRPGDILTTMNGQTVEVLNTDAEGRLVICDVLTYVERFEPELVIDIATLTGACVVALGHHFTGLMSNNNLLASELIYASEQSNDRAWILPMTVEFQDQLDSNFADIANISKKPGGAITAACFLSKFTQKYVWAHLDIAGTAWSTGESKGATGRPVAMLSQFLLNRAGIKSDH